MAPMDVQQLPAATATSGFAQRHASHRRFVARAVRQPHDRRQLERAGWRTTLEHRENLERDASGRLLDVVTVWRAEGERVNRSGRVLVVAATGSNPAAAWSRLRSKIERGRDGS